jgi:hypothetical protein
MFFIFFIFIVGYFLSLPLANFLCLHTTVPWWEKAAVQTGVPRRLLGTPSRNYGPIAKLERTHLDEDWVLYS